MADLTPLAADLLRLHGVPLLQLAQRVGLSPRPSGALHVAEGCPVAACAQAQREEPRPRLLITGEAWTCMACGAGGGPRELLAAALGVWSDPSETLEEALARQVPLPASELELRRVAELVFRRLPVRAAYRLCRAWARQHQVPDEDAAQVMSSVAGAVAKDLRPARA